MAEFKRRRRTPLRFREVPLPDAHPGWLDLDRLVSADHLARQIRFLVEQLDLESLLETYSGVGVAIYPPALLLALVLFETHRGRRGPAQWFTDSRESIPARWLLRGLRPSRAVLYRFRDHLPAELLDWLNFQVLLLAQAEDHTTADNGSLDGTFTAAYGSRHRQLNGNALSQRLLVLDEAITADNAGNADSVAACPAQVTIAATTAIAGTAAEPPPLPGATAQPLPGRESTAASPPTIAPCALQRRTADRPYWLARTAAGRLRQRGRYQYAQAILQARLSDHEQRQKGKSRRRRKSAEEVVICPTDPEAVLGKDKHKVFRPLFNTQIMQDVASPFVLGYQVYAQASDSGLLPTMLERTQQLTGRRVKVVRSDGIYASLRDVQYCKKTGVELYAPVARGSDGGKEGGPGAVVVGKGGRGKRREKRLGKEQFAWEEAQQTYRCPQGHLLQLGRMRQKERAHGECVEVQEYRCGKEHCRQCPQAKQCTSEPEKGRTVERMVGEEVLDELAARMKTPEGKEQYKKRKQTVELRHGDARRHRQLQYFHGYGQEEARSQVGLLVLAHNGLTLLKARKQVKVGVGSVSAAAPPAPPPPVLPTSVLPPERPPPAATPALRRPAIRFLQEDQEWATWN
jgi:transposase